MRSFSLDDQLQTLIDSSPPHIQRHFACDCAERALRRAKVKDKRSWLAVEVGRRYAEGEATDEELDAARSAAEYAEYAWSAGSAAWSAGSAAWSAGYAASAARYAARYAAWSAGYAASAASREEERKWQIEHLQSLIAAHNAARSSLLHILQQRAESIKPVFVQYAHDLKERVFE